MSVTITASATAKGMLKKQNASGGSKFAAVVVRVAPTAVDTAVRIDTSSCAVRYHRPAGAELENYLSGVREGIRDYATKIDLLGVEIIIQEIHVHPIDSSRLAFKIAAKQAIETAMRQAGLVAR